MPNPIGLTSVRLEGIEHTDEQGDVLIVRGADILDGTPIYYIKPYLKFTDSHEDALCGFSDGALDYSLPVDFPEELLSKVRECDRDALMTILSGDPRPSYKDDGEREYGMKYSLYEVFFKVSEGALHVTKIISKKDLTNAK